VIIIEIYKQHACLSVNVYIYGGNNNRSHSW